MPALKEDVAADLANIPRLMDIIDADEFLTHRYRNIYSANYYFEIPSEKKRGNKENLLLSIVFRVQVDDKDWIGKVISFLEEQKPVLVKMAATLKNDVSLRVPGGISCANETRLKRLLYDFYTEVFIQNAAGLVAESVIHQNVWIMSPTGFDVISVLDRMRRAIAAPPQTIRKELLLFLLSRLKFTQYNCELIKDDVENCSVCKRRYIESAACIFMFGVDDGNARGKLEDVLSHIASLDAGITNPFLVLGIDEGERDGDEITTLIDVATSLSAYKNAKVHATQAIVNIDDAETYNELIKWFLSVIL